MKKWGWPLKVFLVIFVIAVLYVLIATVIRFTSGEIEASRAVARFLIGTALGAAIAGIAAAVTSVVIDAINKRKPNLTLIIFLSVLAAGILYVGIASIIRVRIGQVSPALVPLRFIIGSFLAAVVAGVAAGITAIVMAVKKLGD